ncbi:MAG: triose-phosphate isomerase [Elusimicrobia bacterium]|nr:triose-phosphate isomerase [Elusimicrobiota bacterium]
MRRPLIAGNWKMFKTIPETVTTLTQLKKNVADVHHCEIAVCPPFTALAAAWGVLKGTNVHLGAQNCHWEEKGAYTGEVSVAMLADAGCKHVIAGHSERRQYFGETDESVNKRMFAALKGGLIPIVCIGETLQEREKGVTFSVLETQVKKGMAGLDARQSGQIVIAYEPVWAIGTGKTATPQQAEEVHAFIRKLYADIYGSLASENVRVLYGGSVKPENVSELMQQKNIDGGLVGGASLEAETFTKIIKYK